jgi:hypothetical protein
MSADYHPTTITIHPMPILAPLPEALLDSPWSANVHLAHQVLTDMMSHADQVLRQHDSDPLKGSKCIILDNMLFY